MKMKFSLLLSYAKTEGEHTFTITKANGSRRVMTLSGASRTYSHTAEPRNVKFASSIKDWPIKKETTVIYDDSVTIETDADTILIEDYSGTEEAFAQLKVEVNGEVLPFDAIEGGYFVENDFTIYMNITDIVMHSVNGGTYQVKISGGEQQVVAEDFKEAVVLSGLVTIIEGKQEDDDPQADVVFITVDEMMTLLQSGKIVYLKYPYDEGINMDLVTGMYYDAVNQTTNFSAIVGGSVNAALTVREDGMIIISMK